MKNLRITYLNILQTIELCNLDKWVGEQAHLVNLWWKEESFWHLAI